MNSNKNIKIIIAFIIFGVFVSFILNRCQRKMSERIDNEIKEERSKNSSQQYIIEEYVKEKEEEEETRKKVTIKHETEEFYISDISKEDYDIIEFNDDREKEIYGFYGIWINKENNKKYKEGNYGIDEFGDLIASDDIIVLMRDFEYEYYLIKKRYIDSIGIEQCYKDYTQPLDLVYDMCKKNAVYKGRYVSDKFIEKYGDKNGLLYYFDFDEVEVDTESYDYELDDRLNIGNQSYLPLLLIKGKKKTRIIVLCDLESGTNLLEDIEIRDVRVIMNENGEKIKLIMDENNWLNCIERLAFSDDEEVGKSERFIREHPNFRGIFPNAITLFPTTKDFYHLKFDIDDSSFDKLHIKCDLRYDLMQYTKRYLMNIAVDDKKYIDIIELIDYGIIYEDQFKNSIKDDIPNYDILIRLIDSKRDINKLPITNNFRRIYKDKFLDIHNLQIIDLTCPFKDNKTACTFYDEKLNKYFYGITFKIVDNLIDDVEITPLDIKSFLLVMQHLIYFRVC